jgi:predicted deacylase
MKKAALFLLMLLISIFAVQNAGAKSDRPLDPYPSLDEFYRQVNDLAKSHPDRVRLEVIGKSVEGRPLYVLRFNQDGKPKPRALIAAGIHANEYIGPMTAMAAARILASGADPHAQALLGKIEVDIIPSVNPDGYARVYSDGGKGGKIGYRKNADGVDLNRNFPLVPGSKSRHPLAGNRRPKSNYYMGVSELCEPETRAVAELVKSGNFFLVFNLHSMAGKFLYPYTHSKKIAPHKEMFVKIGDAFAGAQKDYHYTVEQSYSWYPTLGDPDDYFYIWLGIPSFTIELSTMRADLLDRGLKTLKVFWMSNPDKKLNYWLENDAPALFPAIEKAYELTGAKPVEVKFPGVNK